MPTTRRKRFQREGIIDAAMQHKKPLEGPF
jgi:hypothetical protein